MATEKESSVGRWQKEFFENIPTFTKGGASPEEAKKILEKFLYLSSITPKPEVMKIFENPDKMQDISVHTKKNETLRDFMMQFFAPIMKNFKVEGVENLVLLEKVLGKLPVTLISNHVSHLDAPAIFQLIYNSGEAGKRIANQITFIAGRLAFEPDFTRLGLYMFDTLLVCSKRDMTDNPSLSDIMTKINMRAFRASQKLQADGKVLSIFPEGTRSRDGRLMPFVDSVYHYVANKIVLPISLHGTDNILPTTGFLFTAAAGKLVIGKPVLVGNLSKKEMELLPEGFDHIEFPTAGDKKQFLIDNLALLVGANLTKHKHGTYRNLYNGDSFTLTDNVLIEVPKKPAELITILGSSNMSVAIGTLLANKQVMVRIYDPDQEYVKQCQEEKKDVEHYPLFKLPPNVSFTSDPSVVKDATILVQGSNPWELRKKFGQILDVLSQGTCPVLNVVKGFSTEGHPIVLDELIETYKIAKERLVVVSGASYPDQVMERKISGFEMAAVDASVIPRIIRLFSTGYVFARPAIVETDIRGVFLGGALKTVYALSMGIVEGYYKTHLGGNVDNTLFHLSNRFFRELVQVGVLLGGDEKTFNGLSGLTDFMLACFGSDNRDRKYGFDLVTGVEPEKKRGYFSLKAIEKFPVLDFDKFPILASTHSIVFGNYDVDTIFEKIQKKLTRIY